MWDAVGLDVLEGSRRKTKQQHAAPAGQEADGTKAPRVLPPAASKGYSVASLWERTAVLTDTQQRAVEALGAACSQRPLPEHVREAPGSVAATPTAASAATDAEPSGDGLPAPSPGSVELASFENVVLQNSSEFYKWLSELEAARAVETEGKYQRHAEVLGAHLAACDELLGTVDQVLAVFGRLREAHAAVSARTAALHTTCDRLVAERQALVDTAEAIRGKLAHFDELERVAAQFHSAGGGAEGVDVLPLLRRLDDSLEYVVAHPEYADSASYSLKFRQLQARALGTLRARVQAALRTAAAALQQAQREGSDAAAPASAGGKTASGDGAVVEAPAGDGGEAALMYIRFRAAAEPALKGLLQGIEARAGGNAEYARLLRDCQALYCEARLALMRAPVAARLRAYAGIPRAGALRAGCAYLLQVAQLERQLYDHLFPGSAGAGAAAALAPLIDPLCTLLYDSLRPQLVGVRDVDELCELGDVLRVEVLEGASGAAARGGSVALLEPVLRRALADVQERLAYRALAFVKESVAGFVPGPPDLDYPAKLERAAFAAAAAAAAGSGEIEVAPVNGGSPAESAVPAAAAPPALSPEGAHHQVGWYPPVQRALLLLAKLYRAVPPKIFNGLAHEAVAAATAAVAEAQRQVTAAQGPVHGQLFAIKQLLVLREQIAPFEADFAVTERELDFSHMRDYLRRTLSGQLPLFSLSSESAVMQLVARAGPRLSESQADAKKELERLLKANCEGLIMHVTKAAVEPMLSFLTKVTAVRVAESGGDGGGGGAGQQQQQRTLREQAFAAPERVAEVVAAVNAALAGPLPEAVAAMRLYLPSPSTQAVLFKPIKSNVVEAHGQVAALLEAEYPAEAAAAVGLLPPQQLAALLDAMS